MRTREEIEDELLRDIKDAQSSDMMSRAYSRQIYSLLLDIRDLLTTDNKQDT